MNESGVLQALCDDGIVAVVRLQESGRMRQVSEALLAGGVRGIEVTLTTPGAQAALRSLAEEAKRGAGWIVGAGSVLSEADAEDAAANGAQFIVSPVLNEAVIRAGQKRGVPVCAAAFTPTELWRAHELGVPLIKLFPAARLGPAFVRDVLAPMPQLRLMPTGGISLENTADWIKAGAAAVGVGASLVDPALVAAGRFEELTARARRFVELVREARG